MLSDKQPESVEADRALLQRVNRFLYQRGYGLHQTLEISVERGVVEVQGNVPTFYLRQIAVECIKRVAGVSQVVDLIVVGDDPRQRQPSDSSRDEQKSSDVSTRHRMDVPDMAGTAQKAPRSNYLLRQLLSSATG